MELPLLIEALTRPAAYPARPQRVTVRQTHISAVFLAGDLAYKVKKPVDLGYLDFSTLAKRRLFCDEEVRLNRRLAPAVYLGVVPIVMAGDCVRVETDGEPVEWAVKMVRLPDDACLLHRLEAGQVEAETVRGLARRIASFHADAPGGERDAPFARFDAVARNARDNLDASAGQVGDTVSAATFARLRELLERHLARLRPLIEARARCGVPRDTHGDLRLDHVYLFPDRPPPDDVAIVDCVEFNERFRLADPVADMAFLAMDLRSRGRADLAMAFADAYFDAANDPQGRELLAFYSAYRAMVRAKVRGVELAEPEVPPEERELAHDRAEAGWRLALELLEESAQPRANGEAS